MSWIVATIGANDRFETDQIQLARASLPLCVRVCVCVCVCVSVCQWGDNAANRRDWADEPRPIDNCSADNRVIFNRYANHRVCNTHTHTDCFMVHSSLIRQSMEMESALGILDNPGESHPRRRFAFPPPTTHSIHQQQRERERERERESPMRFGMKMH